MLNDLKAFEHIYIACGHTDLRYGIDGLAGVIKEKFELDPYTGRTIRRTVREERVAARDED